MAFSYYSPFTIQTGQVPSPQSNFPVLLLPTDNRFRTVGNGGHVQNASGYDIRPYDDAGLTTPLDFELVPGTYDPTSGFFEMHVNKPTVDDGEVIYEAYGDSGISTDGSSTATWDTDFSGVWHLPNGSSLSAADSTANNNDGTAITPTAAAGQIDGAADFNGSSDYISIVNAATLRPTEWTFTSWIKTAQNSLRCIFSSYNQNGGTISGMAVGIDIYTSHPGKISVVQGTDVSGQFQLVTGSTAVADDNWHFVVVSSRDAPPTASGIISISIDGGADEATREAGSADAPAYDTTNYVNIGSEQTDFSGTGIRGKFWDDLIDEVRFSGINRATDWLVTEYNNQFDPNGSFYTLGAEVPLSSSTVVFRKTLSILGGKVGARQLQVH